MFLRPEQRAITSPVIQEKQGRYFLKCNNNPCASACLMGASVSGIDDISRSHFSTCIHSFPLGKSLSKGIWCSRKIIHLQSVRTELINCTNFLSPVKRPACTFALISRNASSWSYTQGFFLIFKYAKNKLNRVIRIIHPVIKSREIIKLHIYGECVIV